jgi:YfiH family protein
MIDGTILEASTIRNLPAIRHGFFTREGGVSTGIYASLNAGLGSDDDQTAVIENRRRIAAHLATTFEGKPLPDIATNYQVHSATARVIERPDPAGALPKADALVTATPGLAIGALTADCTPILFADAEARVIGAAHAGWRGAVSGVLEATINAMESLGANRSTTNAAIGPTISQVAYEVGPEFEAQFLTESPENAKFFTIPPGRNRAHFDLPGFCRARLMALDLAGVDDIGLCTYANESLFFSYRRKIHKDEADYGRQISAIVLA